VSTTTVVRTVSRLGVRSVFGRRRGVMLLVLPIVLLGLAVLVRAMVGQDEDAANVTLFGLGVAIVVPLVALIATSGVLVPEIDDGSIAYLLAKPVSRHLIAGSKLLVAVGCVVGFAAVPMLAAGLVLRSDEPRVAVAYAVGSLVGGAAYCALFALLSVMTRHAVVIGLIYLLVWEGLLGGLLDGVRWLSLSRWSAAIIEAVDGSVDISENLGATYAVVATAVVLALSTWFTGWRLRGFNLTGDE
jgi:ABC-2 type transport system permease protein